MLYILHNLLRPRSDNWRWILGVLFLLLLILNFLSFCFSCSLPFFSSNVWLVDKHQGTKGTDRKEVEDAHPKSIYFYFFWFFLLTRETNNNNNQFQHLLYTHAYIPLHNNRKNKKKNKIVKRKIRFSHKHGRERYFALEISHLTFVSCPILLLLFFVFFLNK